MSKKYHQITKPKNWIAYFQSVMKYVFKLIDNQEILFYGIFPDFELYCQKSYPPKFLFWEIEHILIFDYLQKKFEIKLSNSTIISICIRFRYLSFGVIYMPKSYHVLKSCVIESERKNFRKSLIYTWFAIIILKFDIKG